MERSFLARVHDAAALPGGRHRAGILARPASQTRIFTARQWRSMHRVHASGTPGPRHGCAFSALRPSTVSTFCSAVDGDLVGRKAG